MGAVENMKELADFVKRFNDIELNRRILNLENEVLDLSREKRRADERVEELQRTLRFNKELVFKRPYYWLEGDNTPFCASCWESKRMAVHVVDTFDPVRHEHKECPTCKQKYELRAGVL